MEMSWRGCLRARKWNEEQVVVENRLGALFLEAGSGRVGLGQVPPLRCALPLRLRQSGGNLLCLVQELLEARLVSEG